MSCPERGKDRRWMEGEKENKWEELRNGREGETGLEGADERHRDKW